MLSKFFQCNHYKGNLKQTMAFSFCAIGPELYRKGKLSRSNRKVQTLHTLHIWAFFPGGGSKINPIVVCNIKTDTCCINHNKFY